MVESQLKITTSMAYLLVIILSMRLWYLNFHQFKASVIKVFHLTSISELVLLQNRLDEIIVSFEKGNLTNIDLKNESIKISYFEIARFLVANFRRFGASIRESLLYLRAQIIEELELEEQLKSDYLRGFFQFFIISIFTWIFIYFSYQTVGKSFDLKQQIIIIIFQLAGFFLHHFTFLFQKEGKFQGIDQLMQPLLLSATLGGTGVELNSILELFEAYQKASFKKEAKIYALASRFENAIYHWSDSGTPPQTVLNELVLEAFIVKKLLFKQFVAQMNRIRFVILTIFFLGAYFWQLFSFISVFLIE